MGGPTVLSNGTTEGGEKLAKGMGGRVFITSRGFNSKHWLGLLISASHNESSTAATNVILLLK
jgi:hypothetical protein